MASGEYEYGAQQQEQPSLTSVCRAGTVTIEHSGVGASHHLTYFTSFFCGCFVAVLSFEKFTRHARHCRVSTEDTTTTTRVYSGWSDAE